MAGSPFAGFIDWAYAQPLNAVFRETPWVIPSAQAIHIATLGIVLGAVLMIQLRVLGVSGRNQTLAATAKRLTPWIWYGVLVLLLSGAVMIFAEPDRPLLSNVFMLKMLLVAIALIITAILQLRLARDPEAWERSGGMKLLGRSAAVTSLALFVAIVFAGRLTAYI